MLREVSFFILGAALLAGCAIDLVWTTLGTHGGGPVSGPVTAAFWKGALAVHKRRPNHRGLSSIGSVILVLLIVLWLAMLWGGWMFIYSAQPGAVVTTQSRHPADFDARLYFLGSTISTMGNGDFVPVGGAWRIVTAVAALSGLGTLTLAITFLFNVLPAVVTQRTLASYISDLGGTSPTILERSWDGTNFDSLNAHIIELTGLVHLFTEQHLAYPVLHYFHSEKERTAATLRLASLHEFLVLIAFGAAPEARLKPQVLLPMRDALRGLRDMMSAEFVNPAETPPPPPPLSMLRDLGVPAVDDEQYLGDAREADETRRFFVGLLRDDGWPWDRVSARKE